MRSSDYTPTQLSNHACEEGSRVWYAGGSLSLKKHPPLWCCSMVKLLKNNALHLVDRCIFRIFVVQKGREDLPDLLQGTSTKKPLHSFPNEQQGHTKN